jgi:hypothetical protein
MSATSSSSAPCDADPSPSRPASIDLHPGAHLRGVPGVLVESRLVARGRAVPARSLGGRIHRPGGRGGRPGRADRRTLRGPMGRRAGRDGRRRAGRRSVSSCSAPSRARSRSSFSA